MKIEKIRYKKEENRSANSEPIEGIDPKKFASLKIYYNMVRRGVGPGQARKDCELTLEDIEQFDFSVF